MDTTTLSALNIEEAAGIGAIFGLLAGAAVVLGIIALVWYALLVIARWKIFVKAGEAGWKSIIPIYSDYIQYKIFWNTKFFWIELVISLVASLISSIVGVETDAGLTFATLGSIATTVFSIICLHRMSKSFGHGAGFTIGLIFLNNIFLLILAFNKDQYKKLAA